ncbi:VOC family protein [Kiloniella laminariae]|uniref:VOC family protein n=1 Tax=Kiloniella laminariae TaxID=454162 RepID=UPI000362897C|nr:VOC family protein [Kiloniella laminariae]
MNSSTSLSRSQTSTMSSTSEAPCIFPTLRYRNAAAMIDWLQQAFGFKEYVCYREEEIIAHAELALGSSLIMIGEAREDAFCKIVGHPGESAGKAIYIAVGDVEEVFASASAAGAEVLEGLTDRDYGSKEFICRDPEGNIWCFGTYWPKAGKTPL